ncbi:MAG: TetR/AcrR family transcriptional regulator [Roseiflexaceae bacterium]
MGRSVGVTRDQVVLVGAHLADQHGWESLTLALVAQELKIKLPSLYNHVDGLAGLRRAIALHVLREMTTTLSRATIGRSQDQAVRTLANAYRHYVLAHPGSYMAMVRAPDPDDQELAQASFAIVEVVLAVLAGYQLQGDRAVHMVRGLRSLIHGFATIEVSGGFGLALDRDQSFELLIDTYIAGLRQLHTTSES